MKHKNNFRWAMILGLSVCSLLFFTRDRGNLTAKKTVTSIKDPPLVKNVKRISHQEIQRARQVVVQEEGRPRSIIKNIQLSKSGRQPASVNESTAVSYRGLLGLELVPTLKAIKTLDFSSDMGVVKKEERGMTFFTPTSGRTDENWAHVASDSANQKLFPISSVLKVLSVDDVARGNLRIAGYEEYYYSHPTRIYYVVSSHERLFKDYQALQKQGFKVSLEVLRGQHRSR